MRLYGNDSWELPKYFWHLSQLIIATQQTTPKLDGLKQACIIAQDSRSAWALISSLLWSAAVRWATLRIETGTVTCVGPPGDKLL